MTDTEILDFIQSNVTSIHETVNEEIKIGYYNRRGEIAYVYGVNLRDAVRKASLTIKEPRHG